MASVRIGDDVEGLNSNQIRLARNLTVRLILSVNLACEAVVIFKKFEVKNRLSQVAHYVSSGAARQDSGFSQAAESAANGCCAVGH